MRREQDHEFNRILPKNRERRNFIKKNSFFSKVKLHWKMQLSYDCQSHARQRLKFMWLELMPYIEDYRCHLQIHASSILGLNQYCILLGSFFDNFHSFLLYLLETRRKSWTFLLYIVLPSIWSALLWQQVTVRHKNISFRCYRSRQSCLVSFKVSYATRKDYQSGSLVSRDFVCFAEKSTLFEQQH